MFCWPYFCTRFQVYFGKGVNGSMLLRQNPIPIKAAPAPPPVLAASGLLDTQRCKDFIANWRRIFISLKPSKAMPATPKAPPVSWASDWTPSYSGLTAKLHHHKASWLVDLQQWPGGGSCWGWANGVRQLMARSLRIYTSVAAFAVCFAGWDYFCTLRGFMWTHFCTFQCVQWTWF